MAFFREVLREGRSLIVVRTDSSEVATTACAILDQSGLGMQGRTPLKMETSIRTVDGVIIVDVSGRITLGEGNVMLREIVRDLIEKGSKKILLNLCDVQYVDSSGVGELVKAYTTVRNQGCELKFVNPSKRVHELLQVTRLHLVLPIEADEARAIRLFGDQSASQAVA